MLTLGTEVALVAPNAAVGIYAGDEAVQRVEDGRIVIEVVPGRQ